MASSRRAPVFEKVVTESAFIGVVECVTAGLLFAEFEVVEAWKGEKVEERLRLRLPDDSFETHPRCAWVGERYLVAGIRIPPPSDPRQTKWIADEPTYCRAIDARYAVRWDSFALLQPRLSDDRIEAFGHGIASLDELRRDVASLLTLAPEDVELILLRRSLGSIAKRKGADPRWLAELKSSTTVGEYLRRFLIESPLPFDSDERLAIRMALRAGGRSTLEFLEGTEPPVVLGDPSGVLRGSSLVEIQSDIVQGIEKRLMSRVNPPPERRSIRSEPELDEMQRELESGADVRQLGVGGLFDDLTRQRPEVALRWLTSLECAPDAVTEDRLFQLASRFAFGCGAPRIENLERLCRAEHSMLRTAGAVYLAFEDPERGLAALREALAHRGSAGDWAAVVLASRGDKDAVARLLEMSQRPRAESTSPRVERMVFDRRDVLLSNSAAASGIAFPVRRRAVAGGFVSVDRDAEATLAQWWQENRDSIVLGDPWVQHSIAQKVDG